MRASTRCRLLVCLALTLLCALVCTYCVLMLSVTTNLFVIAGQIAQSYDVNGVRYATLDNVSPADPTVGNQDALLALPEGWTLAASNSNSQLAAVSAPWGTDCLVLADGNVISTTPGGSCTDTKFVVEASGQIRPKLKRIFISQTSTLSFLAESCR